MDMKKEVIILIDGAYLSFITKHFGEGKHIKIRIEKFAENLAKTKDLLCKKVIYYTAPPYQSAKPTEHENERKSKYDKFIDKLKSTKPLIEIREGRCQKENSGVFHQKGVDTLITMDLLKIAQIKEAENIILLTSDTDFVPVIKDVIENHKINVILAYFTDKKRKSAFSLSNHLWKSCKEKILIKKEFFNF